MKLSALDLNLIIVAFFLINALLFKAVAPLFYCVVIVFLMIAPACSTKRK